MRNIIFHLLQRNPMPIQSAVFIIESYILEKTGKNVKINSIYPIGKFKQAANIAFGYYEKIFNDE